MNRDCGLCLDDGQFGSNWFIHRNKYRRPNPDRGLFHRRLRRRAKVDPCLRLNEVIRFLGYEKLREIDESSKQAKDFDTNAMLSAGESVPPI
jgi:hypothetical protein